jgi:hypothetical protein
MKVLPLYLLLMLSVCFDLTAQKDSASRNYLIIDGSYAYFPNPKKFPQQTLSNQRFGYVQVAYLAKLSAINSVGVHFAWEESSFDMLVADSGASALFLERKQQVELGLIYRRQKRILVNDLSLFFQATSNLVLANRRGQKDAVEFKETGTGVKLQMRPGLQYAINRTTAIEAGFGLIDTRFMVWDRDGTGRTETQSSDFNLNMNFNLSSMFVGLKLAF